MNLDDYSYEYDGRRYIDPQVSLDAQNAFIDNLRNTQAQNNAEIQQQTYALGTRVPSNLGGLSGGSSYFKSRYQTPQMNSMVASLKTAAQAQALSTLLQNEIDKAKKKYKDAYNKANKVGGTNGSNGPIDVETKDDGSSDPETLKYKETVQEELDDGSTPWYNGLGTGLLGLALGSAIPIPGLGLALGAGGYAIGHSLPHKGTITKSINLPDVEENN